MTTDDQIGKQDSASTSSGSATQGEATVTLLSDARRERKNPPQSEDDLSAEQSDALLVSRRELMRRVALRLGNEPASIGPVLLAALEELGRALDAGETLALPPLGRLRVVKGSPEEGRQYTIKLRRPKPEDDTDPAEPKRGRRGEDADGDGGT